MTLRSTARIAVGIALLCGGTAVLHAQQASLGVSSTETAAQFRYQVGRRVSYVCPATAVPSGTANVWGTDSYTIDSQVCIAAIHAGALAPQQPGIVTFVMGPGAASFPGSGRNGVTTATYGSYHSSFRFDRSGAVGRIDAMTTPNLPAGFMTPVRIECPPIGTFPQPLWGTDTYSVDSSICAAAAHSGMFDADAGGPVTLTAAGPQSTFAGSVRNGITSKSYSAWPASFQFPESKYVNNVNATTLVGAASTGTLVTEGGPVSRQTGPTATSMASAAAPTVTVTGDFLEANVSWVAPAGAVSYHVKRRVGTDPEVTLTSSQISTTTLRDSIPNPSASYQYQVLAYQNDQTYGVSPWVTFTPPPLVNPSGFTAKQSSNGEASLEWQPVAKAVQYRIDGPGFPNTGALISGTKATVRLLPSGNYTWKLSSVFPGNLMDMTSRSTASAAITLNRQPFLTMNNGAGSAGDATRHMVSSFNPDNCSSGETLQSCVSALKIIRDWTQNNTFKFTSAKFADMISLGAARHVYCSQRGAGPAAITLCYAASHGPLPGAPGFGDTAVTLQALDLAANRGVTLIEQRFDGLHFAAFDVSCGGCGPGYESGIEQFYPPKTSVAFDTEGPKFLPHSCLACHGGQYDSATGRVTGASLLPIDPTLLNFKSPADRAEQEENIRMLNLMVLKSNPSPAIAEYLQGLYRGQIEVQGMKAIDSFIPSGWTEAQELWTRVVKPYCAGCHFAQTSRNDFATYQNLVSVKERVKDMVCTSLSMPHAAPMFDMFWHAGELGSLADFLVSSIGMGSCTAK